MVKNPNWQEMGLLAIYKHSCGVELGFTENNTMPAGGQNET